LIAAASLLAALQSEDEKDVDVQTLVPIDSSPVKGEEGTVVSYADVLDEVRPAVVAVYSTKMVSSSGSPLLDPFFRRFFGPNLPIPEPEERPQRGMGSGFIVSENGYILTNNHVVEEADEIKVRLTDNREFDAELVGADPQTDVAVLKIEAEDLSPARLADSERLRVGDVVFAIGNPLGVGQTVTMGIVSATGRSNLNLIERGYENFIQTDAAINRGNSGGPLVNANGRVVGINTLILTSGFSSGNIGIGFAVPTNLAHSVMTSLVERGAVARGFLGVSIQGLDADQAEILGLDSMDGALISQVSPGTPADKAGLQPGDVIVGVDGAPIGSPSELRLEIAQRKPGTETVIQYYRDGEPAEVTVNLAEIGESGPVIGAGRDRLFEGVTVANLDPSKRSAYGIEPDLEGVLVTSVEPGSPHRDILAEGMLIVKVNGRSVRNVAEAKEAANPGGKNMLLILYQDVYRWFTVDASEE